MTESQHIKTGERYAKSPNNYYRVTRWVEHGDGLITATEKEPVKREDVPEEWLDRLEESDE